MCVLNIMLVLTGCAVGMCMLCLILAVCNSGRERNVPLPEHLQHYLDRRMEIQQKHKEH
jgi:multisubunit Na+/H+ antiporter MnhC subunit